MFFQIIDFILTGKDHVAGGCNNLNAGSKHIKCQVEANLIVSCSCAAMSNSVSTYFLCIVDNGYRLKYTLRTHRNRVCTITQYIPENHIFNALFVVFLCYVEAYMLYST